MDTARIKQMEDKFIMRLSENLKAVKGAGVIESDDEIGRLRQLTGGKLLRNELESEYPAGRELSVRIQPAGRFHRAEKAATIIRGKAVLRLDKITEQGGDEDPLELDELAGFLSAESARCGRNLSRVILGLFSPTGWTPDSVSYILNDPPGSGWTSGVAHPVLIGPEITALNMDKKNETVKPYMQCFCGLTFPERMEVCRESLERDLRVKEFASIRGIASENGFEYSFVMDVARKLAGERSDYAVKKIPGAGVVLKKKLT